MWYLRLPPQTLYLLFLTFSSLLIHVICYYLYFINSMYGFPIVPDVLVHTLLSNVCDYSLKTCFILITRKKIWKVMQKGKILSKKKLAV